MNAIIENVTADERSPTRDEVKNAIDILSTHCRSPLMSDKDPVEIIMRVQDMLAAVSVLAAQVPDPLNAMANPIGGQTVSVLVDTLSHALEIARCLIMPPRPEESAANAERAISPMDEHGADESSAGSDEPSDDEWTQILNDNRVDVDVLV